MYKPWTSDYTEYRLGRLLQVRLHPKRACKVLPKLCETALNRWCQVLGAHAKCLGQKLAHLSGARNLVLGLPVLLVVQQGANGHARNDLAGVFHESLTGKQSINKMRKICMKSCQNLETRPVQNTQVPTSETKALSECYTGFCQKMGLHHSLHAVCRIHDCVYFNLCTLDHWNDLLDKLQEWVWGHIQIDNLRSGLVNLFLVILQHPFDIVQRPYRRSFKDRPQLPLAGQIDNPRVCKHTTC